MTWNNPSDVSTGDNLTSTLWNNFLGTVGSLKYLYNRSTYSTLALGTRTTNQSIANNTNVVVTYGSVTNSNYVTGVAGTGLFTVQETGIYCITIGLVFATNVTGDRATWIQIDGVQQVESISQFAATAVGATTRMTSSYVYSINAGQTIEIYVYQNSGGALNLTRLRCAIAKFG
jgi:hypothetical protein